MDQIWGQNNENKCQRSVVRKKLRNCLPFHKSDILWWRRNLRRQFVDFFGGIIRGFWRNRTGWFFGICCFRTVETKSIDWWLVKHEQNQRDPERRVCWRTLTQNQCWFPGWRDSTRPSASWKKRVVWHDNRLFPNNPISLRFWERKKKFKVLREKSKNPNGFVWDSLELMKNMKGLIFAAKNVENRERNVPVLERGDMTCHCWVRAFDFGQLKKHSLLRGKTVFLIGIYGTIEKDWVYVAILLRFSEVHGTFLSFLL